MNHNKNINQKAFRTEMHNLSNKDLIGTVFICVDNFKEPRLNVGIIGECIDSTLEGTYLKFHFDKDNFYHFSKFRELRNTFGYTAEELREIEWIDGYRIVDIENNSFTKEFLNSPLSDKSLDRFLSSIQDKEPFIKNFNHRNSYHRLVMDIAIKDNLK